MSKTILIGAQWGDEGKGKITDLLSEKHDIIVRFQGGNNAGHTIYKKNQRIVLGQIEKVLKNYQRINNVHS